MAAAQTILTASLRPSTKLHIGQILFGPTFQLSSLGIFQSYFKYYVKELHLHQFATSPQAQLAANLDAQTHEDILPIVSILRRNLDTKKSDLREFLRKEFVDRDDRRLDRSVDLVASRPRIGGYSQARTLQLVWTSWRETQLGRDQLERFSWTGIGYNRTRQVLGREGFLMCICICSSPGRTDSNKQCFHHYFMYTCLLRATKSGAREAV
jgi:hypothetical protein